MTGSINLTVLKQHAWILNLFINKPHHKLLPPDKYIHNQNNIGRIFILNYKTKFIIIVVFDSKLVRLGRFISVF